MSAVLSWNYVPVNLWFKNAFGILDCVITSILHVWCTLFKVITLRKSCKDGTVQFSTPIHSHSFADAIDNIVFRHQDNSYWEPRIWDEKVITIWVALVDATVENGCMQMVKGGHRKGETASHTIGSSTTTWYTEMSEDVICSQLLDNAPLEEGVNKVTIPAKAGSILIFPGTTPHRSLNSFSDNIRWSCDFRLHPKVAARPGKSDLDWFYGLKDSLLLREDMRINPTFTPDFSQWADTDRTECQDAAKGVDVCGLLFGDLIITEAYLDVR
eukprot:m.939477 g.939477  ORF g.939477 m.939477 type:complete len:270 (+) comp23823_c1_seq31:85-894(+)